MKKRTVCKAATRSVGKVFSVYLEESFELYLCQSLTEKSTYVCVGTWGQRVFFFLSQGYFSSDVFQRYFNAVLLQVSQYMSDVRFLWD